MPKPLAEVLTPENGLIFRVTHIKNLPWVLRNGLHCQRSNARDEEFVSIGDPELILKRTSRAVPIPPGGSLNDYVPFYFTPRSPMLLNIKTGRGVSKRSNDELIFLVSSLTRLEGLPFVFTDSHAYLQTARFESELSALGRIDWNLLQRSDFQRNPEDPLKLERYQAEALIHRHFPVDLLWAVACHSEEVRGKVNEQIRRCDLDLRALVRPNWYF